MCATVAHIARQNSQMNRMKSVYLKPHHAHNGDWVCDKAMHFEISFGKWVWQTKTWTGSSNLYLHTRLKLFDCQSMFHIQNRFFLAPWITTMLTILTQTLVNKNYWSLTNYVRIGTNWIINVWVACISLLFGKRTCGESLTTKIMKP